MKELAAAAVAAVNAPTADELRVMHGPAAGRRVGVRGQRGTAAGREQVAKARNRAKAELDELLGPVDEDELEEEETKEEEAARVVESVKKKPGKGRGRRGRRRRGAGDDDDEAGEEEDQ